jgi:hypothetical protein
MLDQELLGVAVAARDRLIRLEHEADLARVHYQHAIRRLSVEGGSMREIADALGLSYQRVHQIVDVAAGKGAVKPTNGPRVQCSFCGRPTGDVAKLIAGPGVFVCDGCVAAARQTIDARAGSDHDGVRWEYASDAKARCGFCGKASVPLAAIPGQEVRRKLRRRQAPRICARCLDLCDQILAEASDRQ